MKRDILFRGKRVDNGEWVYGFYNRCESRLTYTEEHYKNNPRSWIQAVENDGFAGQLVHVDTDTVGQYTGLIDESGNRIFEGDIVNCKSTGCFFFGYVVEWYAKCARWVIRRECPFAMSEEFEYKVIGSIYDNPEWMEMQEVNNG